MALCEQCGSISVAKAPLEPTDKLLAIFTSKRPFVCRRCGWRARRGWTDLELDDLRDYGAGGAEPDPSLTSLDGDGSAGSASESESFDLAALDLADASPTPPASEDSREELFGPAPTRKRRSVRKRRPRPQRREVVATIAVTSMVMLVVVALTMTGSCSGSSL